MRDQRASVRDSIQLPDADPARLGAEPPGLRAGTDASAADPLADLCVRLKADLRAGFARGDRPTAREFFERHPELAARGDKVLSLVYEEFCLLEERGQRPDSGEFCARYADWTASLAEQLQFHRIFSQVAGPAVEPSRYPEPGDRFAGFQLGSEIGRGGAARVYRARDETLGGREVALKVSADRGAEASILGRLDHPNIVPVLSVKVHEPTRLRALCMPYRPGLSLDEVIRRVKPATRPASARALKDALAASTDPDTPRPAAGAGWDGFPDRGSYADAVAWIGEKLAQALAYAHDEGIYHRDVKPANVLLTWKEGPQLLDFNLASSPNDPEQAEAALRGGTLPYMAPEQLDAFRNPAGWSAVGAGADLFSLGLVLRELLVGEPPTPADPKFPLPRMIQDLHDRRTAPDRGPALHRLNPQVPRALEAIVALCLAPDPARRYPSAAALADDLRRFLDRRPLRYARNPSRRERAGNWLRRSRLALAAAAVLVPLAAGLVLRTQDWAGPVERRPEFLAAVRSLDADKLSDASQALHALARGGSDSALLWHYLGAATEANALSEDVERRLAAAWDDPRTPGTLAAWSKTHPKFLVQLADLGKNLLDTEAQKLEPQRLRFRSETAVRILRLVHGLDPAEPTAVSGLALIPERQQRYDDALSLLNSLLKQPASGRSYDARSRLQKAYRNRVRVAIRWVRQNTDAANAQGPRPGDAGLDRVGTTLSRSLDDLHRLVSETDTDVFATQYLTCEALLALGDLDRMRGRIDRAREEYARAEGLLRELSKVAETLDFFQGLKDRVHERTAAAAPSDRPRR